MIKRSTDTIYGLLYRNGRYDVGNWMLNFFDTDRQLEVAKKEALKHIGAEVKTFKFKLEDVFEV
jgi:hypothetical protein